MLYFSVQRFLPLILFTWWICIICCRVQEIFEWIFEVEEDAGEEDPGRIVLSLEYEMDSKNKETYGSTENRVVAQVHIQHDNVFTIVPVIKVSKNTERECPMAFIDLKWVGVVQVVARKGVYSNAAQCW